MKNDEHHRQLTVSIGFDSWHTANIGLQKRCEVLWIRDPPSGGHSVLGVVSTDYVKARNLNKKGINREVTVTTVRCLMQNGVADSKSPVSGTRAVLGGDTSGANKSIT